MEVLFDFCEKMTGHCSTISDSKVGLLDQYIPIWENLLYLDRINMPIKRFSNTMLNEVAKHTAESPQL